MKVTLNEINKENSKEFLHRQKRTINAGADTQLAFPLQFEPFNILKSPLRYRCKANQLNEVPRHFLRMESRHRHCKTLLVYSVGLALAASAVERGNKIANYFKLPLTVVYQRHYICIQVVAPLENNLLKRVGYRYSPLHLRYLPTPLICWKGQFEFPLKKKKSIEITRKGGIACFEVEVIYVNDGSERKSKDGSLSPLCQGVIYFHYFTCFCVLNSRKWNCHLRRIGLEQSYCLSVLLDYEIRLSIVFLF